MADFSTPQARAAFVQSRLPADGLFAEKTWRISPSPLALSPQHVQHLERMGRALHKFNQTCDLLYRQSVAGKKPAYIAQWLDAGKPEELITIARDERLRGQVPAIIRPDLMMTADGFATSELDSVPAGIGLTAWLNETYAEMGHEVLGGATGMRDGFNSILPSGDVLYSEEAAGFIPEMKWLVGEDRVKKVETYQADGATPLYRFFENFDWMSLEKLRASWQPGQPMTPPPKPYLEEKLWLALFWLRPLQDIWRQELSEKTQRLLQQLIPYSWVVDPTPLPPHAVIPELGIHDWAEMGKFSQKQRDLVLKISGFSPLAWGSRGVHIGADLPTKEWQAAIDEAIAEFGEHPRLLQKFAHTTVIEHEYVDEQGVLTKMQGRARLCPYYFVVKDEVKLGGVLATICPADKKILHGMKDAIIVPCVAAPAGSST